MTERPSPLWAVVAAIIVGGAAGLWLGRAAMFAQWQPEGSFDRVMGRMLKEQGDALLRQGQYAAARELFEKTSPAMPSVAWLRQGLLQAEREQRNEKIIAEVKEAIAADDLDLASATLGYFEDGSLQAERRDALAQQLDRICEAAIAQLEATWHLQEAAQVRKACYRRSGLVEHAMEVLNAKDSASARARLRFREGDAAGALAFAHGCRSTEPGCERLIPDLLTFFERYQRLDALSYEEVLDLIETANKLAPRNVYEGRIKSSAATNLLEQAAASAHAGDRFDALKRARHALRLDSSLTGARTIVDEMRIYVKELYLRAYAMKDSDPEKANELFSQVVQLTEPYDEYHQKALGRHGD